MKKCLRSVKYSCTSYDNTFKVAKVFLDRDMKKMCEVSKVFLDKILNKYLRSPRLTWTNV